MENNKYEFKGSPSPWHLAIPTFKGKWAGFNTRNGECIGVYSANEELEAVAQVWHDRLLMKEQDHIANAHLIAAAPELLKALIELLECDYTSGTHLYSAQYNAKQAIDKALNINHAIEK